MEKVKAPKGSQIAIFPMMDCTVAAGFNNKKYRKAFGYPHYGVDFDSKRAVDFEVIASGDGVVVGVEKNKNSIGGVMIIRYDDIYNPTDKVVEPLIFRYYHSFELNVTKGQKVKAYEPISMVSGSDPDLNHIHVEIDRDILHPRYTPQVSEDGSKLLKRKGATAETMINPMDIFVIGKKQKAKVHSLAVYADKRKDAPKYEEG